VVLVVLVLAVAVGAAAGAWGFERSRADEDRDARAKASAAALRFQLATVVISLEGLRGLVEGAGRVDPAVFAPFAANSLELRGGLLAAWAPRVTSAERAGFERRQDLPIVEERAGRAAPAAPRAEYFPVALTEPEALGRPLLGLDLGQTAVGRRIIREARDTGLALMSEPAQLPGQGTVLILARAVYGRTPLLGDSVGARRASFSGVVATATRLKDLGAQVLAELPAGTTLEIREGDDVLLAAEGGLDDARAERMQVAGRTWTVLVGGGPGASPVLPATVLAAGLALAALVWLLVHLSGRRQAEAERAAGDLAAAAERYRAVVETAADGIITFDEAGRVRSANQAVQRIFGWSESQLVGEDAAVLIAEPDLASDLARYLETGERRIIGVGRDVTGLRRDGSTFPLHLSIGEMHLGQERWFTAIVRDITSRVAAEERVRALNDELETRVEERTAALAVANQELEAFSYSVSHDLRAPLRSIDGFSAMLVEDHRDELGPEARGLLTRIRAGVERMGALIDDLLDLARISRAEMHHEKVDLGAMAAKVGASLRAADPERAVELRIAPDLHATGDPRLLRVVLDNLLGNAWKFTRDQPHPVVEVGASGVDGARRIYVKDNGAGFDMAYVDKLFGPFQRLHHVHEFEGTGIGLATVQRIVRRHGGEVWAEGRLGEGATISFTLPSDEDRP
jgi:PAS domain S-box-containing protein